MDRRRIFQILKALALAALTACIIGCASETGSASTAPQASGTSAGQGEVAQQPPTATDRATATLEPKSNSNLKGTAEFAALGGKVTLTVNVEGATPGTHGIHLHEKGDCSSTDAKSAGAHWNPTEESHGKMGETEKSHSGDMGNLEVGADGRGTLTFTSDRWTIGGDPKTDVVGKAIVVHAKADDIKSQPAGDAGDRIGCGVIKGS